MAEGDQSASAAQARSLSGSKHIGQWLLSKVLDKWFGKQLVLWHPAQQPTRAQAQVHALGDKLMQGLQRIAQKIHASEADGSVEKLTTRQRNKERVKMVLKK